MTKAPPQGSGFNFQWEPLRKILELERSKGYGDTAVIGGLDSYLRRWVSEAASEMRSLTGQRAVASKLMKCNYASLSRGKRQEWLERTLSWLAQIDGPAAEGQKPQTLTKRQSPRPPHEPGRGLSSAITSIKGISSALASKFHKLGVETIRDLLYFFPRRHNDFAHIVPVAELELGEYQTIVATVWEASAKIIGKNMPCTEAIVGDETGNVRVVWFRNPYLAKTLKVNQQVVISGRVNIFKGQMVFESPEYELLESQELIHTGRLVPVYPSTEGLNLRRVRRLVKDTVDYWTPRLQDFLPQSLRARLGLVELSQAIQQAHYPDSEAMKNTARRRLAFDELFLMQLGVMERKRQWHEGQQSHSFKAKHQIIQTFIDSLPFTLTGAQSRSLKEIVADLEQPRPMGRLLQGEVGSGKTVVATTALLLTVANGFQAAFMAPTEILAEQHFKTVCQLLGGNNQPLEEEKPFWTYVSSWSRPLVMGLLVGSLKKKDKEDLHWRIANGAVDIVIGTHALIQEEVDFQRLGLVVVDEQHRFGVMQRAALREKGISPHLLVMTATPIPRTLALTLYGDLDISVIDELPPGRQRVTTKSLVSHERGRAYRFIPKEIARGHQAFIICPLIDESETVEARAANQEYKRLCQQVFPDLKERMGLLHGRMKPQEKEKVMRRFREGELDILVATPVVEVGIDVPNATVMLVEGADRFGLSQLHQFRGRVGRGSEKSYCILLADYPSEEAQERMALMERVHDGFLLAEEDLKLRGPGEFFGTRQSGIPDLHMARLSDVALLELARKEAERLLQSDPDLKQPQHQPLAQELAREKEKRVIVAESN